MKKTAFVLAAAGLITLAACNKPAETANETAGMEDTMAANATEDLTAAADNAVADMSNMVDGNAMVDANATADAAVDANATAATGNAM
jgi:hypothetical protein